MKKIFAVFAVLSTFGVFALQTVDAVTVTGSPESDLGWTPMGHSLQSGVYVKGSANYGFNVYSTGFTIESGSILEIDDANDSTLDWLAGDTVVGIGGKFTSITEGEAGWGAFTGDDVNSHLSAASGPRLQAKFGTSDATWFASSVAPGAGDGNSSSSSGGGRVQVRTSGFFQTGTPNPGQTEPWTWDGNSGQLLVLDKDDHIEWDGVSTQPSKYTARMIWDWDDTADHVDSWQLLLNTSLLDRQAPAGFVGLIPTIGDPVIITVQDGSGPFTDALVTSTAAVEVPEPSTFFMAGLASLVRLASRRRRIG